MRRLIVRQVVQWIPRVLGSRRAMAVGRFLAAAQSTVKYRDPSFFQQVFIEINTRCNRRCVYCPNSIKPLNAARMTTDSFVKILVRLQEIDWAGPVAYHFINEPCLHPELLKFVEMTCRMLPKAQPFLFTNADYLTEELAGALVEVGLTRSTITEHPPVTTEWIDRVNRIVKKYPGVFHRQSLKKSMMHNIGGQISDANSTAARHDYCMAPTRVLTIRVDGKVSLCCCDQDAKHTFGNVFDTPILTLWRAPEWKRVRQALANGENPYPICVGCTKTL